MTCFRDKYFYCSQGAVLLCSAEFVIWQRLECFDIHNYRIDKNKNDEEGE